MTIAELGSMGEFVGSIAVVLTLIYLAGQVRYAKSEARRALSQGRAEAIRELIRVGTDERLIRLNDKVREALGSDRPTPFVSDLMNRAEITRQEATLMAMEQGLHWSYTLHMISNFDELSAPERHEFERVLRFRYGPESVGRLYYEQIKPQVHPSVLKYLDSVLESAA